MSRVLYFDCFAGISGDMALGAFLDAGLPLDQLRTALGSLAVEAAAIGAERVLRAGVSATKFRVNEPGPSATPGPHRHPHRSLAEIAGLIDRSALSPEGRARATGMFRRLGEAEAAIHHTSLDEVHLHEVGALDSIVDIVGAVFAIEWFRADRVMSSPLNVGGGTVSTSHGTYPVPAPATARLLGGVPVYSTGPVGELVTPTGALIVTEYARQFAPLPPMRITGIGYGAGERDPAGTPNVLRILVGDADEAAAAQERIVVIECEIDDMNPQIYGILVDRLLAAGALDVFYTPVQMKKGRPGTLVTVLAPPASREAASEVLFRETTTIGLRYQVVERECLARESVLVSTPLGPVHVKVARRAGQVVNAAPEFDECARLAADSGLPVKEVQTIALKTYLEGRPY